MLLSVACLWLCSRQNIQNPVTIIGMVYKDFEYFAAIYSSSLWRIANDEI